MEVGEGKFDKRCFVIGSGRVVGYTEDNHWISENDGFGYFAFGRGEQLRHEGFILFGAIESRVIVCIWTLEQRDLLAIGIERGIPDIDDEEE